MGRCRIHLEPVKSAKTYEVVYQRLRDSILNGLFPPGSKLPSVRELSEQLKVGQSAVREALTALKAMNLVAMRQGEGTFVETFDPVGLTKSLQFVPMNPAEIRNLLELRKILETGTTRLAAVRRSQADLGQLRAAVDKMQTDEPTVGEEADWAFHYVLAQAAQNPFVLSVMDKVADQIKVSLMTSRRTLFQTPGEATRLRSQHMKILHAVEDQDEDRAASMMLAHLRHVETNLELPSVAITEIKESDR